MFETRFMFFPAQLCDVHESGRVLVLLRGRFCDFGLCVRGQIERPVFEILRDFLQLDEPTCRIMPATPHVGVVFAEFI